MNVVIYARYSDSKQREESIEGQLEACHKYAEDHGYFVVHEYIDRAFSARTDKRPQFQQMIHDSGKRLFQVILVYQYDRFYRNKDESAYYKFILNKNSVSLIAVTEPVSDDFGGKMLESFYQLMAEKYSADLSKKVKRGHHTNASKTMSNGGTTPLGYKIENHHYVLDEKQAPIVKEIFQKYADGWSMKQICDNLNERQLKTAQGSAFNKNSLHTMLKNRKYLGIYIYDGNEVPGGMPQIIDQQLFDKVQDVMKANKKAPARSRAKAEYILSGKLFCGYCKNGMVGYGGNKKAKNSQNGEIIRYNYYRCKTSLYEKACAKKAVRKEYIEDIVISECKRLLTQPNIRRIAKEIVKIAQSMDDNSEIKRLEKVIKELESNKDNQMVSLRACKDDAVRNMILEDLSKLAAELKAATEQLEREKARHYLVTEDQVTDYLTQLAKGDISNLTYRKTLVRLFVNKIFLYDDKLVITFTTGDEEVTIEDKLLDKIESDLSDGKLCISNVVVHHVAADVRSFAAFFCKSHLSLILSRLLSKSNPLRWASIWFWRQT